MPAGQPSMKTKRTGKIFNQNKAIREAANEKKENRKNILPKQSNKGSRK